MWDKVYYWAFLLIAAILKISTLSLGMPFA